MNRNLIFCVLALCCILLPQDRANAQNGNIRYDTFYIYFAKARTVLAGEEKQKIDSLVKNKIVRPGVSVLGYADKSGRRGYNDTLAERRAQRVAGALADAGIDRKDMTVVAGKGITPGSRGEYAADRRVMIVQQGTGAKVHDAFYTDTSKIKVNATHTTSILFVGGEDIIIPESKPALEALYDFLYKNPNIHIRIEGHICCVEHFARGKIDEPYGETTLSKARAKAVYNYLIQRGIDKQRLQWIGLGVTQPAVTPAMNDEDMQRNRRVEIRITSK